MSRPVRTDGSATLTIDTSSSVMNPATRQTASARQRRTSVVAPPAVVTSGIRWRPSVRRPSLGGADGAGRAARRG